MKAMVRHRYGSPDVLQLEEIRKPTARDDELLIRVHAVSLNLGDWEVLTGDPLFIAVLATLFAPGTRYDPVPLTDEGAAASRPTGGGLLKPRHKILGTDVAGQVEAVGKNVKQFQPGDEVFGMSNFGALAEYVCVREGAGFAKKPTGMTFEEAAAIPQAAMTRSPLSATARPKNERERLGSSLAVCLQIPPASSKMYTAPLSVLFRGAPIAARWPSIATGSSGRAWPRSRCRPHQRQPVVAGAPYRDGREFSRTRRRQ